jgi:hypothetical protein
MQMDRKFAYYIYLGLVIGAVLGLLWAARGNTVLGLLYGGLAGAGIGWFIAAARSQSQKGNDETSKRS